MEKIKWTEKLRYRFDNLMSKGTGMLLLSLGGVTAGVITIVSIIAWFAKASPDTPFLKLLWMGLMRSLDAGTIGGDDGSVLFMALMFVITICGIFTLSILIGILTSGIESKLESLRRGRSKVIEKDQTIILGWSEQVFPILQELIEANSNQKHACVLIMGNQDKTEMDSAIRERISDCKTTRIVTRQGNPIDIDDLDIVSLNTSRSIIILPEDDISAIKTILSITNHPNRRETPYHIVTALRDPKNVRVAQIAGNHRVEIVMSELLISRIIAQTCRQPGLSLVYTELLDFGGDEIYFKKCPALAGKTFGDALALFETSTVIGICHDGVTTLNPPMDTVLQPGDEIIAISEDDDTVVLSTGALPAPQEDAILREAGESADEPEKTLILGWNANACRIIRELDQYVAHNSLVTVVSDSVTQEDFAAQQGSLTRQSVELLQADPKEREVLDDLMAKGYNHVIILCDSEADDLQQADSNTLVVLIHLRDIADHLNYRFSVVSEMLDFRNKKLAETTKVNDFVVSEKLISLMLTQVSENKRINSVLQDIFDADGSEIYLKRAKDYVALNKPVSGYTLVEAARRRGELAIGYVIAAEQSDASKSYGIHVNPKKSGVVTLGEMDSLIVIAED